MRTLAFILVAIVAGCGSSGGPTQVTPSSTPPAAGSDGGAAAPGGGTPPGDGGGGGGMGGGGGVGGGGGAGGGGGGGGSGGGGPAACTLPGPTQLVASHAVRKILVAGDDVYYLDVASAFAGLYRVAKTGGTPTLITVVIPFQSDGTGWDFTLDDTAAYVTFSRASRSGPDSNGITIVDRASGTQRRVALQTYGCTAPFVLGLAAFGGTVWFTQRNIVWPSSSCTDAASTTIEVLTPGASQPQTLAVVATGDNPILADGTHIFWSGDDGTFRALHDGSAPERLAPIGADKLATDGNALFATVGHTAYAITAPGQFAAIYSNDQPPFYAIDAFALDDTRVYLAGSWGIVDVSKSGGGQRTAVTTSTSTVAVDTTNVYYFIPNDVMTACK